MLKSMTGFASKTIELTNQQGERGFLTITLKSLNSRHFEAIIKMPPALQSIEVSLLTALKQTLHRGKVTVTFSNSNPNLFKGPVQMSLVTLQGYLQALDQVQKQFSLAGQLHIADIINLPNVLIVEECEAELAIKKKIEDSFAEIIKELCATQEKEGAALLHDIQTRCGLIENNINAIEKTAHEVFERKKEDVEKKLTLFSHDFSELDQVRRQLQIELEKSDIHEEIVRFKNHLHNLQEFILAKKPIEKGRQIDFILQELSREINTAAAKCADSSISSRAINIKVDLEKIREQTQNVI